MGGKDKGVDTGEGGVDEAEEVIKKEIRYLRYSTEDPGGVPGGEKSRSVLRFVPLP